MDIQEKVARQDLQINQIFDAEERYKDNPAALIKFWENIWNNGGLLFNGSKWTFRLPDLYIEAKEYDKALDIIDRIDNPTYQNKKNSYIQKIEKLKAKQK